MPLILKVFFIQGIDPFFSLVMICLRVLKNFGFLWIIVRPSLPAQGDTKNIMFYIIRKVKIAAKVRRPVRGRVPGFGYFSFGKVGKYLMIYEKVDKI